MNEYSAEPLYPSIPNFKSNEEQEIFKVNRKKHSYFYPVLQIQNLLTNGFFPPGEGDGEEFEHCRRKTLPN